MRRADEIDQLQSALRLYPSFNVFQAAILGAEEHLDILADFRSVCWKIFLTFRTLDEAQWLVSLTKSRSVYDDLCKRYLRVLQNPDELESDADPLSEDIESPWAALRQDEVTRQEIFQDVERCMPENTYFRQPETQAMMLDILFVYTKLNPDVGYRQGMHELLAPILWVVERDSMSADDCSKPMHQILDAHFVEHDTFILFAEIMKSAKSFYDPASITIQTPGLDGRPAHGESAMILRSRRIFSSYLSQYDPGLTAHLEELEILPQLFLMRWIRLLLGREFSFDDVLQIWDLIFADDPNLELIDYICVAMLLRIRWQLIDADTNEALMLLMRYPAPDPEQGPRTFVKDALYLRSHPGFESGYDIIKKYSDRVPLPFKRPIVRPSTPDYASSPSTPPSVRARSPFAPPTMPNFQSLLNDAKKGALNRGEKWGLNQALRDAVGEVRKNVQNLQAPRHSPLGVPAHRANRSSETAGTIAANVLRKLTALENRNKQLAQMLETATGDLWSYQQKAAEAKGMNEDSLNALSTAIAKVQFVQVFLQDSTLPIPQDEVEKPNVAEQDKPPEKTQASGQPRVEITSEQSISQSPPSQGETAQEAYPAPKLSASSLAPSPISAFARPASTNSPPPVVATTSVTTEHASATSRSTAQLAPDQPITDKPTSATAPATATARPRIEQSNYSWMLGQSQTHDEHASGFARASTFAPAEKSRRQHHKKEQGFLFGEDSDVVGERRVVKGRARKGSKDVRSGAGGEAGRVDHEDIGLDDVKREGSAGGSL